MGCPCCLRGRGRCRDRRHKYSLELGPGVRAADAGGHFFDRVPRRGVFHSC